MRIVISDYSGHPFQVELSRSLAARGHQVLHLHFAEFPTPKGKLSVLPGDPKNFHAESISTGQRFDKGNFLRRWFVETKVGNLFAARAATFSPDVVFGCNMPLDAQRRLRSFCAKNHIHFVFWLQDVYSQAIGHYLSEKFGVLGQAIGAYYTHLEGRLLRSADAVVAISDKFVEPLERWGVDTRKVFVVPNWAPLSEIYPVGKCNEWALRHLLRDKLVALYTGTLGLKHDPSLLLDLARAGTGVGMHVVVVSEGAGVAWLAKRKQELHVDNLMLLPFQPMDFYPQVLGAGDIVLAMVGEEASSFSVPSKIMSYLAAGKPLVASIAQDNDAAQMIGRAQAGIVVRPGDAKAFCDAVLALATSRNVRESLGRNGRAFAERTFDIGAIADRFEMVFARVLSGTAGEHPAMKPVGAT